MKLNLISAMLIAPLLVGCQQQPTSEIGRYRIHSSDQGTVLLDSATGKTWLQVYSEDNADNAAYWEPSARQDNRAEWREYNQLHPSLNSSQTEQRFGPPKKR